MHELHNAHAVYTELMVSAMRIFGCNSCNLGTQTGGLGTIQQQQQAAVSLRLVCFQRGLLLFNIESTYNEKKKNVSFSPGYFAQNQRSDKPNGVPPAHVHHFHITLANSPTCSSPPSDFYRTLSAEKNTIRQNLILQRLNNYALR